VDAKQVFEILVREHADMLSVYLRSVIRDPATADDLFQETLLVAWRRLDDFDRSRPFGPWLRGIAGRLVLAQRRRAATRAILCDEELLAHLEQRWEALQRQPGDTLEERLSGLRDCLDKLPPSYQEPVRLRYREELSLEKLAEQLRLSLETIKKRLQRGRARLLDCLQRKLAWAGADA